MPISCGCEVAILTPAGRGAVATIAVMGSQAEEFVGRFFKPASGKPLPNQPLQRILFGRWMRDRGSGEEVVVCRRGETSIEVHCHGGRAACEAVVESLIETGARRITAQEWADRHAADRISAAACIELSAARTQRTAGILLDQYRGALRSSLDEIVALLRDGDAAAATARLKRLIELAPLGQHLTQPWRVVFAGLPNVGKSSLINALLGYSRSIVFDQPGTTRDVVTAQTALDGWLVELVDTAGLRSSDDDVESQGVARAHAQIAAADLALLIVDASRPISSVVGGSPDPPAECGAVGRPPHNMVDASRPSSSDELNADAPPMRSDVLTVYNKVDLVSGSVNIAGDAIATSTVTGQGIDQLARCIVQRLIVCLPDPGEAVPFTVEQADMIARAAASLAAGNPGGAAECIAALA